MSAEPMTLVAFRMPSRLRRELAAAAALEGRTMSAEMRDRLLHYRERAVLRERFELMMLALRARLPHKDMLALYEAHCRRDAERA